MIESWRITRRKLGLGQPEIGEFHLMIEVKDLAQLDRAFDHVAERSEPTEGFHFGVNSLVQNVRFASTAIFPIRNVSEVPSIEPLTPSMSRK